MKKNLLNVVLFAAGLAFASTYTATKACAADDPKVITTMSFNDANSPAFNAGTNSTLDYTHARPIGDKKGNFLNVWGANNTCSAVTTTITETDMTQYAKWTLEFDWSCFGGCNGKTGATKILDANGNAILTITDAASWNTTVTLSDGNTLAIYGCEKTNRISANTGNQLTAKYWYHFTIEGTSAGIKYSVAPYNEDGVRQATTITKSQLSATNASPATLSLAPGSCGSVAIDSLSLTESDAVAASYNYKVKYVCDGQEIKEAVTRNDAEGSTITLAGTDMANFFDADGVKYIYVSNDADGKTVAKDGSTVVNVTFRKAEMYTYTVSGNDGAILIASGAAYEGETVKIDYPAYQLIDGTLYSAKKLSSDGKGYYFYMELTEDMLNQDIAYDTKIADNVIYYIEAEDNLYLTPCDNANTVIRSSKGGSAYAGDQDEPMLLDNWGYADVITPGKYKITSVACDAAGKTASAVFSYYIHGFNDNDTVFTHKCSNINWDSQTSDEFTVDKETSIYLAMGGKASQGIDLFYLQKTGDYIPTYPARNTPVGNFGTICLPYAFNAKGADIYSVSLNEEQTEVILTKVEGTTEAGVAYLYAATASEQTFEATGEYVNTPDFSGDLIGTFADREIDEGYVLQTKNGEQQFYYVDPTNPVVVPMFKAYLYPEIEIEAKALTIGFAEDDYTTSINALNALIANDAKIYDINGRQLKSLQKGVNIVNGAKVLVK